MDSVELLAFGAHPDDVEIGMAGTIARAVSHGRRVGIVDLTRGEMGTNGSVETRAQEAAAAGRILGVAVRENLGLPDRGLDSSSTKQRAAVAAAVRRFRPQVVCVSYSTDRHPDHIAAHHLVNAACFDSGLVRFAAPGEPWRPRRIFYYFINLDCRPDFIVDVTHFYQLKVQALAAHRSQFAFDPGSLSTALNQPGFPRLVRSRDAYFGALIDVEYGEGFMTREPLALNDLITI